MIHKCIYVFAAVLFLAACQEKKKASAGSTGAAVTDTVPVFVLSRTEVSKSIELPAELQHYDIQNTNQLRLRVAVPELYVSTGANTNTVSFRVQSNPY